jgi:ABC-type antimicrobial peptide transport system permease subunit
VGKHLALDGDATGDQLDIEIVGLARDAGYANVKDEAPPLLIMPYRQDSTAAALAYYVRTSRAPEQVLQEIPRVIARLDRNLPVSILKTMPQQVRDNVYLDRMTGTLSAAFAALATLLAAVGLYGVLAYTVAQRTREIGVRMALGADDRRIRAMVLRQVGRMTLVGGVMGVAAAFALGRLVQSLLFGMTGNDPMVIGAASLLLAAVVLCAGYVPARRASRLNPVVALRSE